MPRSLRIIFGLFFSIKCCIGVNLTGGDISGCEASKGCFFGDDTVIACVFNGTSGYIFAAWNDKTDGHIDREATWRYIDPSSIGVINSDMKCSGRWRFQPRPSITNAPEYIMNLSSPSYSFHILFARGYADRYSAELMGHSITDGSGFPWISKDTITFCQDGQCSLNGTDEIQFPQGAHQSAIPRIVKHFVAAGHAIFMMGSFWIFAGPAILTARYLKCQKSSCWYGTHGIFMIIVFILVTIAFFGNFYQAEWRLFTCSTLCVYEDYVKFVHTIVGIFTYVCVCLQVIVGIFRPKKESSKRPCANWFHTGVGIMAWIGGSTACVLGCHLGKTGLYEFGLYPQHVMTVVIGTFIMVAFLCEVSSRRNKYIPEGVKRPEGPSGGCNSFSVFLVIVYSVVAVLAVALLTVFLFSIMYTRGFRW
ncbi:hypothetical protein FO519_003929 [Halicephalobus sp. NKZ332]|nr:hypothetical protein FO519_003929 [Halicephalobus sp. NKZ332]